MLVSFDDSLINASLSKYSLSNASLRVSSLIKTIVSDATLSYGSPRDTFLCDVSLIATSLIKSLV